MGSKCVLPILRSPGGTYLEDMKHATEMSCRYPVSAKAHGTNTKVHKTNVPDVQIVFKLPNLQQEPTASHANLVVL